MIDSKKISRTKPVPTPTSDCSSDVRVKYWFWPSVKDHKVHICQVTLHSTLAPLKVDLKPLLELERTLFFSSCYWSVS